MTFPGAPVDIDDPEALLAADHDGALRAASMAGAQVRATAAAPPGRALRDPGRHAGVDGDGT